MSDKQANEVSSQLEGIKRLLIMMLIDKGFKQGQIAAALAISDATLSTMFPKGLLKDAKRKT